MNEYLSNLKEAPDHKKKRFAFTVAFSFSFLVLVGWLGSYFVGSSAIVADNSSDTDKTVIENPVNSLSATVIGAWTDLKNIISGSNKVQYSKDSITVEGGSR